MKESTDNDAESDDIISDEQIGSEFEEASNSYHMNMENEDGAFHFELNPDYFEDVSTDFPDKYPEYTIFAEVDHCFEQNEKEYAVDLMNMVPQQEREQKLKIRRMWGKLTEGLNEIPGRDFSTSDFHLSAPDIRITPIAIYR